MCRVFSLSCFFYSTEIIHFVSETSEEVNICLATTPKKHFGPIVARSSLQL